VARGETATLLHRGLDELAGKINRTSQTVMVFNPSSWPRTEPVKVTVYPEEWKKPFDLVDAGATKTLSVEALKDEPSLVFLANDVPPMGYKLFRLRPSKAPRPPPSYQRRLGRATRSRTSSIACA